MIKSPIELDNLGNKSYYNAFALEKICIMTMRNPIAVAQSANVPQLTESAVILWTILLNHLEIVIGLTPNF